MHVHRPEGIDRIRQEVTADIHKFESVEIQYLGSTITHENGFNNEIWGRIQQINMCIKRSTKRG